MRTRLLALHAAARANPALQRLAVISRILLAFAFIPTAFVKILGHRFTMIPIDNPVGFFFEAMYRTGLYWRFIGWGQLTAGILLLMPRTATLGAILFFPIVLNIFVITLSMSFAGTPVVTGLMLLAALFLLCWDYDRLETVLFAPGERWGGVNASRLEQFGFALGLAGGLVFFFSTRSFVPPRIGLAGLAVGAFAALLVGIAWVRGWRAA
jgi:hypothetical protein